MYQIKYITYPEQVQFELQLQLWGEEEEVQALIGEVAVVELLVAAAVEAAEELQGLENEILQYMNNLIRDQCQLYIPGAGSGGATTGSGTSTTGSILGGGGCGGSNGV